eukprot:CAMPEP_0119385816 /NCGR_PEP_ID=MMETSP1334-20130426/93013_1 /TAXON_ID=127549 /ORGANISM="Calcidiscus leptoporus, Strain RCC1130" /LENGTH=49 /DNA_ID= /DNA_START= /DNA_END= /DNA_ORIENTATION=
MPNVEEITLPEGLLLNATASSLHQQLCNATPETQAGAQPVCRFAREVVL